MLKALRRKNYWGLVSITKCKSVGKKGKDYTGCPWEAHLLVTGLPIETGKGG